MIKLIINDIYTAFLQYTPLALLTGGVIIAFIFILIRFLAKKVWSNLIRFSNLIGLAYILYSYCFIVVCITLLSRESGSRDSLDLIPFSTFSKDPWSNIYPIENVILFIPFGLILPFLYKVFRNIALTIITGFTFSVSIEIIQYLTKRGFFQIDDIITNVIGTLIGYSVAYGIQIFVVKFGILIEGIKTSKNKQK